MGEYFDFHMAMKYAQTLILSKGCATENTGLFTNLRVDPDSVPEGWYAYGVSEREGGSLAVLEQRIGPNHSGTFLTQSPVRCDDAGKRSLSAGKGACSFPKKRESSRFVLCRASTKDGIPIQIEDWSGYYPTIHRYADTIAAYPIAPVDSQRAFGPTRGEAYRISLNLDSASDVCAAFEALVDGRKSLLDYSEQIERDLTHGDGQYGNLDLLRMYYEEKGKKPTGVRR